MADDKLKWRISPEQILEAMRYFKAADLKTEQAKLSGAASQMEKLLGGRLSHLLTQDEVDVIRQAADLVRQLNTRVEHAKEIKKREEKREENARLAHQAASDKAVNEALPVISRDAPDIGSRIISMAELLLALHREKIVLTFMSEAELVADMRRRVAKYHARHDSLWEVADYLRNDLRGGLESYLGWDRDQLPKQRLTTALEQSQRQISSVRVAHADFFAYLEAQVAIEQSENVERLPVKPKR
ncbi:hypothetical protein ACRCRN_32300 [Pseudomonas aeruginosa]